MFHVMVLTDTFLYALWKSICSVEKTLMNRLENALERKKIVNFLLCEDVVVLPS